MDKRKSKVSKWPKSSLVFGLVGTITGILSWVPWIIWWVGWELLLISWVTPSLAVGVGIVGLKRIRNERSKGTVIAGKGICVIGIVLGALNSAFWVLWALSLFLVPW